MAAPQRQARQGLGQILVRKQITQRTDEWLCARKKLITATDCAAITGRNKYKNADKLLQEKLGVSEMTPFEQARMDLCCNHGTKHEPVAIARFEASLGVEVHEVGLFVHQRIPWIGASPDGVFELDGEVFLVEVKCPLLRVPRLDCVPPEYYCQMQIQMEVIDVERVYFVQFVPGELQWPKKELLLVETVDRDREYFAQMLPQLRQFHARMCPPRQPRVVYVSDGDDDADTGLLAATEAAEAWYAGREEP